MPVDRKDPHERAKRLARLIVGDIVLYNQDKIAEGIKNDTLFQVLEKELEVGRKYYEK
ncbi:MAG: histidine kinase, partial [candidate division NC10 bacterium]|nr:histidine kinase [candidate division NC10 bacterium]